MDAAALVRDRAEALPDFHDPSFGPLFDRLGNATVVLLGEASHGTSEFYEARALVTRRLIVEHGFTIVAVEADWPDAAQVDLHVRPREASAPRTRAFDRFPSWMWRNTDVNAFTDWLRRHNESVPEERRVGFYGLDLYSLGGSIAAVLQFLDRHDPEAARVARRRYGCLTPYYDEPARYGYAALQGLERCQEEVVATLGDLLRRRIDSGGHGLFDAQQNARVVAAAEEYYRAMYRGSVESWNLRDTHMFETLRQVLARHGPEARAVVWAHNSHIGNAAATEMGRSGEINIGQLCKGEWGAAARSVGFGTDRGTVAAASDWDMPMEVKRVRPALEGSFEALCRETGRPRFLLDFGHDPELRSVFATPRLERAIGVIYRPETERQSHYFRAELSDQFDLWLWFEETRAVTPLGDEHARGMPETYPFGV